MPSREVLKKALSTMHGDADYQFFFENLNSVDWLPALEQEGMLSAPPPPIIEGTSTRFPFWAPAVYLINIANRAPERVMEIILKASETNNPRVHEAFVDAAAKMPPNVSKLIVPKLKLWLEIPYQFLIVKKSGELILHLLHGNEDDAAFDLIKVLFTLTRPHDADESIFKKAIPIIGREWEYEKLIETLAPNFNRERLFRFLEILIAALKQSIAIEDRHDETAFMDYSHIWRGTVEPSSQNRGDDIKNELVTWITSESERLIAESPELGERLIERLMDVQIPIFVRIAFHLLLKDPARYKLHLPDIILDSKYINSSDVWHEYSALLLKGYPILSDAEKRDFWEKVEGLFPDKSDNQRDYILYPYYFILKDHLEGEPKNVFDRLHKKIGELEHPDLKFFSEGVRSGNTSPISSEELRNLSNKEIVSFIKTWKQPKAWLGPTIEGLGLSLQQVVASSPEKITRDLELFKLPEKTFVRAIIQGFTEAASKSSFAWPVVLGYLDWAVRMNDSGNLLDVTDDRDPSWSWTRSAACRLIEAGFRQAPNVIPLALKNQVWEIIANALRDPDPTIERDTKAYEGKYFELAINSTRGQALECAIEYGLWILRQSKLDKGTESNYPELIAALNEHLDLEIEPSLAIRSIYGSKLPWLFLLDEAFTTKSLPRIFPCTAAQSPYRDAAWNTYVTFCQPYKNVFRALEHEYHRAVADFVSSDETDDERPNFRLVEHIIILYLVGELELTSELFTSMMSKLSTKQRKKVIFNLGTEVSSVDHPVRDQVGRRAIAYLSERLTACRKMGLSQDRAEVSNFGWWMRSLALDDKWVLAVAKEVIELTHDLRPDHFVLDRLLKTVASHPKETADVLSLMVENKVSDHGYMGWLDEAKELLRILLREKDTQAQAINIIHKFGALGFREFGQLLNKDATVDHPAL